MDRQIVYYAATPLDTDFLSQSRNVYIALAKLASAIFGNNTLLNGFVCSPGTGLNVTIAPGEIYNLQNLDNAAYGNPGLPIDTTHQILKQGINLNSSTLACPAPATSGTSINYLVEIGFSEQDGGSVTLPYYNSTNPAVPFTGPNNSPIPQNSIRQNTANVQIKAGTAATTGSQITPTVDAGFTAAFVITIAYGATAVNASNISTVSGAPFITETLTQKISAKTALTAVYAIDSGTANNYVATLTPAPSAYTDGMTIDLKVANTNTGASVINVNGLGNAAITTTNLAALVGGELTAGAEVTLKYDGTRFQLKNPLNLTGGNIIKVPYGGTGLNSFTAYAPIVGGTSATGALQSVASLGTRGQTLVSNGSGTLPSFQGLTVVNEAYLALTSYISGTAQFIPQTASYTATTGNLLGSITYTPQNSNNYLVLDAQIYASCSVSGAASNFLGIFTTIAGSTTAQAIQVFDTSTANQRFLLHAKARLQANTTNSITVYLYGGINAAGTFAVNGSSGALQTANGATYLHVIEYTG